MELCWKKSIQIWMLIGMTVLADVCFYGWYPVGWTMGAYLLLLAIFLRPKRFDFAPRKVIVLELGGVGLLALSFVYGSSAVSIVLAVLFLLIYRLTMAVGTEKSILKMVLQWPLTMIFGCLPVEWAVFLFCDNPAQSGTTAKKSMTERVARQVGLWSLPVIVSLIFLQLFMGANPVFEQYLDRIWAYLGKISWPEFSHVLFYILTVMALGCFFSVTSFKKKINSPFFNVKKMPVQELSVSTWNFLQQSMTRGLILFNLIFLLQNVLDVEYLWAGLSLPAGMTYAEYAHRGAYPLIAAALLSGILVLMVFRKKVGAEQPGVWSRRLVFFWLLQNIFLIVSSMLRLEKYVSVYSLTMLRLSAFLWMALVALGMVFLIVKIARDRDHEWLLRVNILAGAALLIACSFLNLRGFVADYNVDHCREVTRDESGVFLDDEYLYELGIPALPALERANKIIGVAISNRQINKLRAELDAQVASWRQWTLKKYWIKRTLIQQNAEPNPDGK